MKRLFFVFLINAIFSITANGQSREDLSAINQVWERFYKAFEQLDYNHMAEIHSKDLVRISGGSRISDYDSYISNYNRMFGSARESGVSNRIELRFFERINNGSVGSERGVYKLIRTADGKEQAYYGQFHVIFRKENDEWKILVDYDSTEGGTIGENEFNNAKHIEDIDAFARD